MSGTASIPILSHTCTWRLLQYESVDLSRKKWPPILFPGKGRLASDCCGTASSSAAIAFAFVSQTNAESGRGAPLTQRPWAWKQDRVHSILIAAWVCQIMKFEDVI